MPPTASARDYSLETLADLVAELGAHARAATPQEAAKAGDVVVATVPMSAYDKLPAGALAGKIVIDTMNYYPERDGRIASTAATSPQANCSSDTWPTHLSSRRSTTWTGSACTAGPARRHCGPQRPARRR
ncbi:NADPH-dependent F420 reductase [Streptomyces sp. LARHCF252]